jgi:GT2 family glycosyltransferase
VTHDSRERVEELLAALRLYTRTPHEIFVVDNASTDGTRELLAKFEGEPGFKLLRNPTNQQCAAATNLAIAATRTEYVIYLCASHALVAEPGWEEPLVRFLDERPEVEIAGHVWNPGFALPSKRYSPGWTPESHGIENLGHVQGGAWIARRILFDENGFFDQENFPHGGMDVELSYRLLSYKKPLGNCPAVYCPPSPEKADRRNGTTVYHPASRALRDEVRKACGLEALPEDRTVALHDLDKFSCRKGRVGFVEGQGNGLVVIEGNEPGSGLLLKAPARDASVRGRLSFDGEALLALRARSQSGLPVDGYELVFGPQANYVARRGEILSRFELKGRSCHFVFHARGAKIALALDGRRVLELEDKQPKEGHVFVGVRGGQALYFDVTVEPFSP